MSQHFGLTVIGVGMAGVGMAGVAAANKCAAQGWAVAIVDRLLVLSIRCSWPGKSRGRGPAPVATRKRSAS